MHREEWIEKRRKTLGASDVPIILGISPFGNAHDVWISKMGMDSTHETQSMRMGNYLQRGVAMEAINQVGGSIIADEPFAVHANGWASATPDCIIQQDGRNVILEIKCTHEKAWDYVPENYILQVHWQCWVHGIDQAYIAVLNGSLAVKVYEVIIDLQSEWFLACVNKAEQWWKNHVIMGSEPPWGTSENKVLIEAIRADVGSCFELDQETFLKLQRIAMIKKEISPLKKDLEALEKEVKETMGTREIGLRDGKTLITWKETVSKTFDTDAFKSANPTMTSQYQKTTITRRFLPKDTNEVTA